MSSNPDSANPLITEILTLLSAVTDKFEPGENEMRQWMTQSFQNPAILEMLDELTIAMLRVVDTIGRLEPVNGITISKQAQIPKGTVSKITRRLIAQKLVNKESLPNNKKEIIFSLTPLGKELFHAHRAFDEGMERGFVQFMSRYSDDELRFLVHVLKDVIEMPLPFEPPAP